MTYQESNAGISLSDLPMQWMSAELAQDTVELILEEPHRVYDGVDMLLISKKLE